MLAERAIAGYFGAHISYNWNFHLFQLELSTSWNFHLAQEGDHFITDIFDQAVDTTLELRQLNAVRLNLKVATISDIAKAGRHFITAGSVQGRSSSSQKTI